VREIFHLHDGIVLSNRLGAAQILSEALQKLRSLKTKGVPFRGRFLVASCVLILVAHERAAVEKVCRNLTLRSTRHLWLIEGNPGAP